MSYVVQVCYTRPHVNTLRRWPPGVVSSVGAVPPAPPYLPAGPACAVEKSKISTCNLVFSADGNFHYQSGTSSMSCSGGRIKVIMTVIFFSWLHACGNCKAGILATIQFNFSSFTPRRREGCPQESSPWVRWRRHGHTSCRSWVRQPGTFEKAWSHYARFRMRAKNRHASWKWRHIAILLFHGWNFRHFAPWYQHHE